MPVLEKDDAISLNKKKSSEINQHNQWMTRLIIVYFHNIHQTGQK